MASDGNISASAVPRLLSCLSDEPNLSVLAALTMAYSPEELDWIEAEWAFHLHGRSAFLSREDFLQLQTWGAAGIPADAVVAAMEAYFQRRAKRARPKAFIALSHLEKDVQKARKLRQALANAGDEAVDLAGWGKVDVPLREDPHARVAFEAWRQLQASAPAPDSPAYLEHFDAERKALQDLVALAEAAMGPRAEALRETLRLRLAEAKLEPEGLVWRRAWGHHWGKMVLEAWGIPGY